MKFRNNLQVSLYQHGLRYLSGFALLSGLALVGSPVLANELSETVSPSADSAVQSELIAEETVQTDLVGEETSSSVETEQQVEIASLAVPEESGTTIQEDAATVPESAVAVEEVQVVSTAAEGLAEGSSPNNYLSRSAVNTTPLVEVSQTGTALDISYNGAISQAGTVLYAVWTEDRKQDDLMWYTADKSGRYSVDLSRYHRSYGVYNIHAYQSENGKMTGLAAITHEVRKPVVDMNVVKKSDNDYQVVLTGLTSDILTVQVPMWTENKQQDDLIWQTAKKEADGTYTATLQLSQHHYESGKYLIHVYGQSRITGTLEGLLAGEYTVERGTFISNISKTANDYTVTLSKVPSYITSVKVPIWSVRDGQDDIIWYTAHKQVNGDYVTTFKLSDHKNNIGDYAIHAYGQTNDGQMLGLLAQTYRIADLEVTAPAKYQPGQIVEIQSYATHESNGYYLAPHQNWIGRVKAVAKNTNNTIGGWEYHVVYDNGEENIHVLEQDIRYVYQIGLSPTNNRTQNNRALQAAFDYAKTHRDVTLYLPAGDFVIGSSITEEELSPLNKDEYIILSSHTKLRGNDKGTRLIVDGTMLWFGLPTGVNGVDGVSHLTIDNIHVRAKDLVNGDYFMVMLNHGNQIRVQNSSFTLVQKQSRHIFDLGGVQNATFTNNQFIGYAPGLTKVTSLPTNGDWHPFYAEVIQFDQSNNLGSWDAGMIKRIAKNDYMQYNRYNQLSNNISLLQNAFLPFYQEGRLVAYSSTVGQHSSQVGTISIIGNRFEKTLATRYNNDSWYMKPIHYVNSSGASATIRDNKIL